MKTRIPIIAANWKMNKTNEEAITYANNFLNLIKNQSNNAEIIIAPSFVSLFSLSQIFKNTKIKLSAQNLYFQKEGAYTGEISGQMLLSVGCEFILLGHSERRHILNENDEIINKKLQTTLSLNMKPIFCIGEKKEERDKGKTFSVLETQIEKGLNAISLTNWNDFIIAYEPVWAIGTGDTATEKQVDEVHTFLRELLIKKLGKDNAESIRILYGGSVNGKNINSLMKIENVDGALVGGASLKPDSFFEIVNFKC